MKAFMTFPLRSARLGLQSGFRSSSGEESGIFSQAVTGYDPQRSMTLKS